MKALPTLSALAVLSVLIMAPAEANNRLSQMNLGAKGALQHSQSLQRQQALMGKRGVQDVTSTTTRDREAGIWTRQISGTTRAGGEFSRETQVSRDAESGTINRVTTGTNANGSWSAESEIRRTENGWVSQSARTNANGEISTSTGVMERSENGWTRTQTTTGANGGVQVVTVTGERDPETGTVTRSREVEREGPPKP